MPGSVEAYILQGVFQKLQCVKDGQAVDTGCPSPDVSSHDQASV